MTTRRSGGAWRWGAWVVLAAVVAVALVVGASRGGGPATPAQRAAHIDALLRCPSCEGISVADSSASTAVAIRQAVTARVRAGQSDAQIEAYFVSRYGPGILLRPPARGATAWVWVLPPVGVAAAAAGLGALFWRRRRVPVVESSEADRALVDRALRARAAPGDDGGRAPSEAGVGTP